MMNKYNSITITFNNVNKNYGNINVMVINNS